ncbi:MAG: YecA family protein [Desulfuromonadales bacterium]
MKTGRNDPCPCGSGLKYKKCCADKDAAESRQPHPEMAAFKEEMHKALAGQSFGSLEEVNAFLREFSRQRGQAPKLDFHGLSAEQMHRLLYFPFESPQLVTFPTVLDGTPSTPIMTLFTLLAEAIGDKGLKPTATGNLPRNVCREAALAFLGEDGYREHTRFGGINSEPDFAELHVTRLVAELAGLVRKYNGKFILGRECRKILAGQGAAGIYPRLFRAFVREYNWGFLDRYPELPLVQQSFLFTLFLLKKHGIEWRSSEYYADAFLRAFPTLVQEVPSEIMYLTPERMVSGCYSLRALDRFAEFLGLAEIERDPVNRYAREFRLRKLPLLEQVVRFHC